MLVAWYWAAQIAGSLGLGDLNITQNSDLLITLLALLVAALCRCIVMARLVVLNKKQLQLNPANGIARYYLAQ